MSRFHAKRCLLDIGVIVESCLFDSLPLFVWRALAWKDTAIHVSEPYVHVVISREVS